MNQDEMILSNAFDLGDISSKNLSGAKKAAVLLMALGPEASSSVIKSLTDTQVQKIGFEVANINSVNSRHRNEILKEFVQMNKAKDYIIEGGIDYARLLLAKALGSQKANKILEGINDDQFLKPFSIARKASVDQLINAILQESPQTIALILCYVQPEKAAQIILGLPEDIQKEVAFRIGNISSTSPAVIEAIEKVLEDKLSSVVKTRNESCGGVDTLVEILTQVDRKTEKGIISQLEIEDYELAEKVKNSMFVFEDIVSLDNMSIQRILREVDIKDLAYALKGTAQEVALAIYRNQSKRAAETLQEEIELLGPVRISEVEESQQKIVAVIRKLEEEGEIFIARGKENEVFI
jgi:flagellar motor switch protein FliG